MKITNEQLSAYLDNALTPDERAAVDRALAQFPETQRELARLRQLSHLIKDLPSPEPSEAFYSRVLEKTKPHSRTWLQWTIPLVGAAAAAMIMIFVVGEKKGLFRQSVDRDLSPIETTPQMIENRAKVLDSSEGVVQAKGGEIRRELQSEIAEKVKNEPGSFQQEFSNELWSMQKTLAPGIARPSATDETRLPEKETSNVKLESKIGRGIAQEDIGANRRETAKSYVYEPSLQTKGDNRALSVSKKQVAWPVPIKPTPPSFSEFQKSSSSRADKDAALKDPSAPQSMLLPEDSLLPRDWQGNSSGINEPREVVIKDASSWAKFWAEHQSNRGTPIPAPVVDFKKQMVVGIFIGDRGSSGFSVEITDIKEVGKETIVSYRETHPSSGRMQLRVMTQPYPLRAIPRTNRPIRFKKL